MWNAVYGPTAASRAAQAARPSIPSYAKYLIARVAAQAKCAKFKGGTSCTEASVEAFLRHEMFSGGSVPKFEKSKSKKARFGEPLCGCFIDRGLCRGPSRRG